MSAYPQLTAHLRRIHTLETVSDLLSWDEQVMLPAGAAGRRSEQMAAMAEVMHAAATDPRIGRWLEQAERESGLDEGANAVLRQARRDFERATRLPADFVREKASAISAGYHIWAEVRAAGDFARYVPVLEQHLDLARREAALLGRASAYDHLIDQHDPGMTEVQIAGLFRPLQEQLVPLARELVAAEAARPAAVFGSWPAREQEVFLREVTTRIGFDYRRGRIDVSLHPFCSGSGDDVRMTTRFQPEAPLDSLFSAIHETGHGLYEQGLPVEGRGTALGMHAGMAVHESQSRLWENQVGRSRGFWRHFEPRLRVAAPLAVEGLSPEEVYRAVNAIGLTSIRVDSDEVTYNLHILLRFELERRLFAGTLAVRDLPEAWRAGAESLIGLAPRDDREGVLQDVHWSGGSFGYFPSYTLGNMMAAQLWYTALAARPGLEDDFASGEFGWLLNWLRTNVHAAGRRHPGAVLIQQVTGQPLSPDALLRYLRERYGALYLGPAR